MVPVVSKPLVLVAEDDELFAQELASFFRNEGWECEVVGDGLAALGRLRQDPTPRLVCLDLVLPGIDGWRFYAEIRRNERFPRVSIVVLTSKRTLPDEELAGILAFVRKPAGRAGQERFEEHMREILARIPRDAA